MLRSEAAETEEVITGKRPRDQVEYALAGLLFPPLALAIDQQRAQKAVLDQKQAEIDAKLGEQHSLRCPN